jgi:putative PIN family toxin of toxin-antitoxin system
MRVVLDTNVLVSATLIRQGNEDRILRAWQGGAFELVISPRIIDEIGRVLFHEKLRKFRWMTEKEVGSLLESLAQESVLVPGRVRIKACRDPDDDKFVASTFEAKAKYVVTGDKDLLSLKSFKGIQLITPASFLKVLKSKAQE